MAKKNAVKTEQVVEQIKFAEILRKELSKKYKVESGISSDESCSWLNLKKGKINLSFEFDGVFGELDNIWITKDILQVVDQKKIVKF
jgi:hypothetical protein